MSARKTEHAMRAAELALYAQVIAATPGVEQKGATHPYTSCKQQYVLVFASAGFSGFAASRKRTAKIPEEIQNDVVRVLRRGPKGIRHSLLRNTGELQEYFSMSYQYAQTLKPKPSKGKSPA